MKSKLLLHIGYHKTASSWMQRFLFKDSAIGFTMSKQNNKWSRLITMPHPFDYDPEPIHALISPWLQETHELDRVPVISYERFSGCLYAGGFDSQILADRLVRLFPDAHILIVIREQKNIIYGTYSQFIREGGAVTLKRFLHPYAPNMVPGFRFEHFMYHRLIQYYYELFGRDRVLVVPYELFAQQPEEFTRRIVDFCGLSLPPDAAIHQTYRKRVNQSFNSIEVSLLRQLQFWLGTQAATNRQSAIPMRKEYLRKLQRGVTLMAQRLPESINRSTEKGFRRQVANAVGTQFQESNAETARLTGLDLQAYGYGLPPQS